MRLQVYDVIAGKILVSGSVDQTMKIWEVDMSYCQRTLDDHMDVITVIKLHVRVVVTVCLPYRHCL